MAINTRKIKRKTKQEINQTKMKYQKGGINQKIKKVPYKTTKYFTNHYVKLSQ